MSEEGTAVLERTEEEMSPGGLFTKAEFEKIKQDIGERADSRDEVPREAEQTTAPPASEPSPEPEEAKAADEPSREPESPENVEPEVSETAEPAEEKADEESPAAKFDDQLLARADQMGFSQQDAKSFGTPDNLEIALTVLDKRLIGLGTPKPTVAAQATVPPVTPAPVAPPVQPIVQAQPAQAPPQQVIAPLVIDLNSEDHDPAIVEQFQKLHAHYEARANQIQQVFVQMFTGARDRSAANEVQAVNQAIDGLNGDMKGLMTDEIRAQIHPSALGLARGLSQSGLPVPGIPELVERAARGLLSKQLLENETKRVADELSAKLEKRSAQRTPRPVQHQSAEPGLTTEEKRKQDVADIQAHINKR